MGIIITFINITVRVLSLLVFVYSLLSFFLSPYSPVQRVLSQIVEPMLTPIRNRIPPMSGIDLSPLILIVLLQVVGSVLVALLRNLS
ncbi:MAG: YggT family protein [Chloroflexota bacterium]|nr:YggT family protein [Chloroflexota bacterium]